MFVFIDLGVPLFDDAPTIILGAAGAATLVRFDAATFASLASARLGFAGVATALANVTSATASRRRPQLLSFAESAGIALVGSRGRQLVWPMLLVIGLIAFYGSTT